MEQMPLTDYLSHYRSRFPGPHLEMVVASMLAGNTAGELWAGSDPGAPLLLWDKGNNGLYLTSEHCSQSSIEALAAIIATQIRPRSLNAGAARFKAYPLSSSMQESLPELFPGVALHESVTRFFADAAERPLSSVRAAVPDMTISPITPDDLAAGALAHGDWVRAEISSMWPSEERFHQHGFGTVAVVESEIICWCTAEYVSPAACGIGIETSPRYEGRGVATATAARFLHEARKRGVTAHWECDRGNHASVRVAQKLGFVLESEETVWIGSF